MQVERSDMAPDGGDSCRWRSAPQSQTVPPKRLIPIDISLFHQVWHENRSARLEIDKIPVAGILQAGRSQMPECKICRARGLRFLRFAAADAHAPIAPSPAPHSEAQGAISLTII